MEDWKNITNKYSVILDSHGNNVQVDINVPKLRAENLHFQTWGSARVLAGQLHTINLHAETFDRREGEPGIDILELGAGTGLAGLAAAALWQKQAILTDLAPFIPGLAQNIDVNQEILALRGAKVLSGALDWNSPSDLPIFSYDSSEISKTLSSNTDKASVVIAADTLYSEDHPRMLANAIFAWLRPGPASRVIVCYPLRVAYLDIIRDLWRILEEGGLEAVLEGREEIMDEVWDDERLHEWCVFRWKEMG